MNEIDFPEFKNDSALPFVFYAGQKYIINITEENHKIVLFSSCGKINPEINNSDKNKNESVTWVPCKGMDERLNYKIGHHPTTDLFILHASADPSYLDSVTFREWIQEFIEQTKNWCSIVAIDQPSTSMYQQHRPTNDR